MNTDQIAAEAAWEIFNATGKDFALIKAEIQAAIEKAIKAHDKEQHYYAALGEAESRATHASEKVEVCQSCGSPVDSGEEYCSWCNVETRDSR